MIISLSGLDMSWLKDPAKRLPEEMKSAHIRAERRGRSHQVMPDLNGAYAKGGFESPIDGTWISSRSQLREHNKRHGVIQSGDIRGERLKSDMKRHMKFDRAKRADPSFAWVEPSNPTEL